MSFNHDIRVGTSVPRLARIIKSTKTKLLYPSYELRNILALANNWVISTCAIYSLSYSAARAATKKVVARVGSATPMTWHTLLTMKIQLHPSVHFRLISGDVLLLLTVLLVLLYTALNGMSWSVSSGWLSSDSICDWAGVLCIDDIFAGQTVRSLSLINIGLSGTLPTEIALFPSLRNLDLSSNTLMGPIPSQIGSLNELATLNLQQNRFSGSIPTALSSLSTLEVLEIGFNLLTNKIPTELGQLSSLTRLSLEQNSHLGTIPTELGRLQNLLELVLNDCSLLGKIPTSIGAMTSLEKLWLEANFLTDIPTEIGNLSQLRLVSISRNEGLGELPSEIGNLSNLGEYI